jgi:transposase
LTEIQLKINSILGQMATLERHKKHQEPVRITRYFSEDLKLKKVREFEQNLSTIRDICREYGVSRTAVYKWIYKYSAMRKKSIKQVVEAKSDTVKISRLKDELKAVERVIGQKQILIEFLEKMIELAEEEYGIDIKKKYSSSPSSGSGAKGRGTRSK